ncbi:NAD(P)H-dependent oxidoreductase [Desulfovibrio sp.]|uniref:flavodoxin family protein n=1 Tax=Desulfovibrio sp. TaxID=885 RepID=UPI0025C29A1D|nr:NAD(P)H-dependent oxidoreductase [Desulfovibrio sp.]
MCSPHAGGVSDLLAETFAAGLEDAGCPAQRVPLREHPVEACTGCGACAQPPHACVLAGQDEAEWLFACFAEAPLVLLTSSIYFYALPATFKAWIDRGQRFWAARAAGSRGAESPTRPHSAAKPVLAALAAGRPRGEELFSGALRTLAWFATTLGARLVENRVFRGLDRREDLCDRPQDLAALREWGGMWGRRLTGAEKMPCHAPSP